MRDKLDEDDGLLLDYLYRSRTVPLDQVDDCLDEYRIGLRRGTRTSLREIIVKRGILTSARTGEIIDRERNPPSSSAGDRPPSSRRAPTRAASSRRRGAASPTRGADDETTRVPAPTGPEGSARGTVPDDVIETARVPAPTPRRVPAARERDAASWVWSVLGLITLPALIGLGFIVTRQLKRPPLDPPDVVQSSGGHGGGQPDGPDDAPDPVDDDDDAHDDDDDSGAGGGDAATAGPGGGAEGPVEVDPPPVPDDDDATGDDDDGGDGTDGSRRPTLRETDADALAENVDPIARVLEIAASSPPEAPAIRRERFDDRRALAKERYEQALARIDRAARLRKDRFQREAARAISKSTRRPFPVSLATGMAEQRVRVTRYDEDGFTLRTVDEGGSVERDYRWHEAPNETALRVKRVALDKKDARDLIELARFCLGRRLFAEAAAAADEAYAADPALRRKARLPDLEELARRAQPFRGRFERLGGSLIRLSYDFDTVEELHDFLPLEAEAGVGDGALVLEGDSLYRIRLRDIEFEDNLVLEAELRATEESSAVVGVLLGAVDGKSDRSSYIAFYSPDQGAVVLAEAGPDGLRELARGAGGKRGHRIRLTASGGRLGLWLDGRKIGRSVVPPFSGVTVVLGGLVVGGGFGRVGFDKLEIRGRASRDWVRKTFAEVDAIVARELDEDILMEGELASRELGATDTPEWLGPLSSEDRHGLAAGDPETLLALKAGRDFLARGDEGLVPALEAFHDAVQRSPDLAAARYLRALAARMIGEPLLAAFDAARACSLVAEFHEAHALLALALADLGRAKEALEAARRAVRIRPDSGWAYVVLGRALFENQDLRGAQQAYNVAVALNPGDLEARSLRRHARHVLRGPPWTRSFESETAHYVLRSNIDATRCRFYADKLEAVHAYYVSLFGRAEDDDHGKSQVLIFDTAEGYHTYAELTTDDRVESTLGYYHPKYRQLLLYEDKDDTAGDETLRVLYHEGFHQFIHAHIPEIPYWLNEGLAEYFAATTVEDGRVKTTGGILEGRLDELRRGLAAGQALPFARIMTESPEEFYSGYVSLKYAQAWAMIHFFMNGDGGRLRPILDRYVNLLRRGATKEEAFAESFGKVDLRKAQREWQSYVGRLGR